MRRAFDSAASDSDLAYVGRFDVAFHQLNSVGTRDCLMSELNLRACVYPCRCYTHDVTIAGRRFLSFLLAKIRGRKLEAIATYFSADPNSR